MGPARPHIQTGRELPPQALALPPPSLAAPTLGPEEKSHEGAVGHLGWWGPAGGGKLTRPRENRVHGVGMVCMRVSDSQTS